jgi:hypothetical protein
MDKQELESKLVVGAKIKLSDGEIVTLVDGVFEYDNGLYTDEQHAPSVWDEKRREYDSIYHLFGNDLEDFDAEFVS